MTSRRFTLTPAAWLACLFSLLLLLGTPMRLLSASTPTHAGDWGIAITAMADDEQDASDTDAMGQAACDDNSGGMDDILHSYGTPRQWAFQRSQVFVAGPYDVGQHAPGRLLRPPEAA